MPRKLRRDLPELFVRTAREESCSGFKNGELLRRISKTFEVLVTIDQRMRYQQNVAHLAVGVVVIELPDTRLVFLRALVPQLREAIERIKPGEVIVIGPA